MATSENNHVIEAVGVQRSFGKTQALRDFNLQVSRGSIYGFLGRNGAGKTTAIKMLVGLIKPDGGEVRVLGKNPFEFEPADRQKLGYLSERQILPPQFRVGALAQFCSQFYPKWDHALTVRLLKRFQIDPRKRISALSQGTQRQVGFILALAQRPELLILDEPASSLDVVARREFLDEVLELIRQDGPTVLISSHILSDIERVADQIGIIADGHLLLSEPLDELKDSIKQIRFHSFTSLPEDFAFPGTLRMVRSKEEILITARLRDPEEVAATAKRCGAQYEVIDLGLEEIFVELAKH